MYSIPQACVFSTTLIYKKDGDFRKTKWKPDRLWAFTIREEEWSLGQGAYPRAQPKPTKKNLLLSLLLCDGK